MVLLTLLFLLALASLILSVFLLGFRLGGEHWLTELTRVRATAAEAQRTLHNLTRQAFVAMSEEALKRRSDS